MRERVNLRHQNLGNQLPSWRRAPPGEGGRDGRRGQEPGDEDSSFPPSVAVKTVNPAALGGLENKRRGLCSGPAPRVPLTNGRRRLTAAGAPLSRPLPPGVAASGRPLAGKEGLWGAGLRRVACACQELPRPLVWWCGNEGVATLGKGRAGLTGVPHHPGLAGD